jgi:hypothetical protein
MTRNSIIEKTLLVISKLPEDKAIEISDFAEFVFKKYEEELLTSDIQKAISDSKSFDFLAEEEELYTINDIKKIDII